ncbi:MAG TPA: HAD family hydrolase [Anaerolineaceae bacterium]|nr:HAD family hydrolase [Anaerolineaceae bacterium]
MSSKPTHFPVILFDLGNTLIYSEAPWPQTFTQSIQALTASLRDNGVRFDEAVFKREFERRMIAYYDERDTEFIEYTTAYVLTNLLQESRVTLPGNGVVKEAVRAMYAVSQAGWQPEADALPMLETLRSRGYRLGLISNAPDADDVAVLVDKAGVRQFFEIILVSASFGRRKPHPAIFQQALDYFGVRPQNAVMVGDTLGADIVGANQLGMASVWITRRAGTPGNRDHLDTIQPTATIKTLAELPGLLAGWE